ncbi:MAG: HAD-IIB family hydrolase [Acholeplasmatales bacterium]
MVLITGRPYRGCINFYEELGLNTPLIVDNGASIYGMGNFPDKFYKIPKKLLDEIFLFTKDHLVTVFYTVGDYLFSYKTEKRLEFYFHLNENTKIIERPYIENDLEAPLVIVAIKKPFHKEFEKFIYKKEILNLRSWGEDKKNAIYEIYLKGIHKGHAMNDVIRLLGHDKTDVIAFGDGDNDIELISYAHRGIAMKNAADVVKKVSDEITLYDNHENGVIKHLKGIIKD